MFSFAPGFTAALIELAAILSYMMETVSHKQRTDMQCVPHFSEGGAVVLVRARACGDCCHQVHKNKTVHFFHTAAQPAH